MRSLKQKLRSNEGKDAAYVAVAGLQHALDAFRGVAGSLGVPGLQHGIACLSTLLAMMQKAHGNSGEVECLTKKIEDLTAMVKNCSELHGSRITAPMQARIDRLLSSWKAISDDAADLKSRNKLVRILKADEEAEKISSYVQKLSWSIQSFMVESTLAIEYALDDQARASKERYQSVTRKLDVIQDDIQRLRMLSRPEGPTVPPYAVSARFDCRPERIACLEGTRTRTLESIYSWAQLSLAGRHGMTRATFDSTTSDQPAIFWVNGLAGTGKTTIAYTVAERCHVQGVLGASFFCSRSDSDCSSPSMIFTTIAFQLGLFFQPFRDKVADELKKDPLLVYSSVSRQFEHLILQPITELRGRFPGCIVVIDALDECHDAQVTSAVLSTLLKHAENVYPLRFFLTSRPERHIVTSFDTPDYRNAHGRLLLHEVALQSVTEDISRYLRTSLSETRRRFRLPQSWPSQADVQTLSDMANGLFIFAATAVRFIEDENYNDPIGQLKALTSATGSRGAHQLLDHLYQQLLDTAFPSISKGLSGRIKSVLGSIVVIKDQLPVPGLARLVGLSAEAVYNSLNGLHSVIVVPAFEDSSSNVSIIHPTFAEFLLDPSRCTSRSFVVDSRQQHTLLLYGCLHALRDLRRDICDIRDPSLLNCEIPDLPKRIEQAIPPSLRYACRHWTTHLSHGALSDHILGALLGFAQKRLLHWIEACSLLGVLRDVIPSLNEAQGILLQSGNSRARKIALLLNDCERLIIGFFPAISSSALQLYHSILPFVPKETSFARDPYSSECSPETSVRVLGGVPALWSASLATVTAHEGKWLEDVDFSPDGKTIVSCGRDNMMRFWDALTCTLLLAVPGRGIGSFFTTARYSRDGTRVVSAHINGTVQIWDPVSGVLIRTFEGHTRAVHCAVFTPDGHRIISGSDDHSVRIWDARKGTCLATLMEHQDGVHCVTVSPDGQWMASSSSKEIFVWNLRPPYTRRNLKPRGITKYTLAFTPDSSELLTGPSYGFVGQLAAWDVKALKYLRRLKPSGWPHISVNCMDISENGDVFTCDSHDNTVVVLDVERGELRQMFAGHRDTVRCVAFSPDSTRIVSGSWDGTIRLWSAEQHAANVAQPEYTGYNGHRLSPSDRPSFDCVSSVFSHDGSRVLEVCVNWEVEVEKTDNWDRVYEPLHVAMGPRCAAFSPDGTVILTASTWQECEKMEIWDAASGARRVQFAGICHHMREPGELGSWYREGAHPRPASMLMWSAVLGYMPHCFGGFSSSMMFSQDSRYLVSGSVPAVLKQSDTQSAWPKNSAWMWDVVEGRPVREFPGHDGPVLCVAFSLDRERVVTGSADNTVIIHNATSGQSQTRYRGHTAPVFSVAFSSDTTRVVSGDEDGQIHVSNLEGNLLQKLSRNSQPVLSVAFTPTADIVVTSCDDGALYFWDVETHGALLVLEEHDWYHHIRLSADGSSLIVNENGRVIRLWAPLRRSSQGSATSPPWPPCRAWPMYCIDDGWIISITPSKRTRLCWLPTDWREIKGYHGQKMVLKHRRKLDFSALTSYLERLYA